LNKNKIAFDFTIQEKVGRLALKELITANKRQNININFTYNRFAVYDAYWTFTDHFGKLINCIAEIKVRHKVFDSYIIEKRKIIALHKKRDELISQGKNVVIYYFNFTPKQTLLWNVTDFDTTASATKKEFNSLSKNRMQKVEKEVYNLSGQTAKIVPYKIDVERLEKLI
jgi:hypothetical protein